MLIAALSAGDKLSVGGITTLLGLGMTFTVLVTLIGCIFLLERGLKSLNHFLQTRKSSQNDNVSPENPEQIINADEIVKEPINKVEIDQNTMSAISQAVALFSQQDDKDKNPHNNIVIKSVTEIK